MSPRKKVVRDKILYTRKAEQMLRINRLHVHTWECMVLWSIWDSPQPTYEHLFCQTKWNNNKANANCNTDKLQPRQDSFHTLRNLYSLLKDPELWKLFLKLSMGKHSKAACEAPQKVLKYSSTTSCIRKYTESELWGSEWRSEGLGWGGQQNIFSSQWKTQKFWPTLKKAPMNGGGAHFFSQMKF